jgi:SulP family sulfate permease
VIFYSINGPLFFGAAEQAIAALRTIEKDIKVVVFMMEDVMAVDMTGMVAMDGVISELKKHGIKSVLVGVVPSVKSLFLKSGIKPTKNVIEYADTIKEAVALVGARLNTYRRRLDLGPIRLHPLHKQRQGEAQTDQAPQ